MYSETKKHLYSIPEKQWISHHGIMGQKWGVQNGPPYPLDSDVSTGKRLKESKGLFKKKKPKPNKIDSKKDEFESDDNVKTLSSKDIDDAIKNTKVNTKIYTNPLGRKEIDISAHYKNLPDGSDIEVYAWPWPDEDMHVNEDDIKKVAREVLENKKAIKEACDLKIMAEEAKYWYVEDIKDKMTPKEWLDNLDIRGVYVTDQVDKKGKREVNYDVEIEEKKECKEDLLGGHFFSCRIYIDPKSKRVNVRYVNAEG